MRCKCVFYVEGRADEERERALHRCEEQHPDPDIVERPEETGLRVEVVQNYLRAGTHELG